MTSYSWGGGSGSITDSSKWTDEDGNNGTPGASDTADFGTTSGTITGSDTIGTIDIGGALTFSGGDISANVLFIDKGASVTIKDGGDLSASHNISGTNLSITATGEGTSLSLNGFDSATKGTFDVLAKAEATVVDLNSAQITVDSGTLTASDSLATTTLTLDHDGELDVTADSATFQNGTIDHHAKIVADGYLQFTTASFAGSSTADVGGTLSGADLDISGGAAVMTKDALLNSTANGQIQLSEVSGGGSSLTVTGELVVGEWLSTSLVVTRGGTATIESLVLAETVSGKTPDKGTLLISGANSTVTTGDATIGEAGDGVLSILDGSAATNGQATLAEDKGSVGHVLIDGGEWTVGDGLTVGGGGKAEIDIGEGGKLIAQSGVSVGEEQGSSGKIVLGDGSAGDGPGHLSVAGNLVLGASGSGALTLDSSQAAVNGAHIVLGEEGGAKGTLTMNGGSLKFTGEIVAGEHGKGSILLNQGATANDKQASLTLGEKVGATGSLTLDGGSSMNLKELVDGEDGKGSVTVKDGSSLTVASADLAAKASSNANGVSVNTQGSFTVTGNLAIGEKGFGTLSVASGGHTSVSGEVAIGEDAASIGSVTISGAATVGNHAVASSLGYGTLEVGAGGSGMLTIAKGASVTALKGGAGSVEVAAENGSTGTLTLTGTGSQLQGKTLAVGGTEKDAGGSATVTISSGATATFSSATVWSGAKVSVNGGTLHLTGGLDGDGKIAIGENGTLVLDGSDKSVAVSFSPGSSGAELELGSAKVLAAAVKGFVAGDSIEIGGIDKHATFSVAKSGSNTVVSLQDDGKSVGSIHLAGHFTASELHLSASGILTTTVESDSAKVSTAHLKPADHNVAALADSFVFDSHGANHAEALAGGLQNHAGDFLHGFGQPTEHAIGGFLDAVGFDAHLNSWHPDLLAAATELRENHLLHAAAAILAGHHIGFDAWGVAGATDIVHVHFLAPEMLM
ncbi:MAG: hypothetical protein WBQ17_12540 [Rhizomicrobium sp.]